MTLNTGAWKNNFTARLFLVDYRSASRPGKESEVF